MYPGKLIKYHRNKKQITQKELAQGICSVSYLSKIENESIEPSEDVLKLLSERLGLDFNVRVGTEKREELRGKILDWYELIKNREAEEAKILMDKLEKAIYRINSTETKNLFLIIRLCYFITFGPKHNWKNDYVELRNMKDLFNTEALYYFYKFESLYYYYENNLDAALESLKEAEKVYPKIDLIDLDLYYNLSIFYKRTYQVYKSTIYAYKALNAAQAVLDYSLVTECYMVIAANNIRIGEYETAEKDLLKLQKHEATHIPAINSLIHHNLGYIYYQWKEYKRALKHLYQSIDYASSKRERIGTFYIICLVYYTISDYSKLKEALKTGKIIAHQYNIKSFIYKFYILENKMKNNTLSQEFLDEMENKIIPYFKSTGERNDLIRFLKLVGDIYYEKRLYKKSAEYYQKTHSFYTNAFRNEDNV
ncbi:transcriptional regulator with XRE-family HTH domain [Salirhabdus euzebyi]|uniref:Transcriptional regulator with XRE-family HTH domain n=1 Tax=Salirhabdus euzebyi TaxID=394506 RepID=A0A841Q6W0_9BACI|nr:helix-turn-helix transcriptional regulator [Salirhabdus euzebyi]MBB6454115.1 transcriptional regulator with XRE-family HTH domain [Salirhabdus euzebyi]